MSVPPQYAAEYGMHTWRPTQIQSYVQRCCDPGMEQLNLPLALELADYVNTKRANTAREAAFEVVQRINSRVPHVGMLALDLLDILVKNCGFLIHLQIATKEFLNELVRRFPERPPMHPGPVMTRILEMIHEWRQTICVTSKHKEDLVHIRDMHRLLMYKGYRFPKVDARSAAVLSTAQPLQSPDELEEETRLAQSAKLQELIRRGTPRDLQQAQVLMKILSGAEPEKNGAQERQVMKEMDKIESRTKLLGDMLDQANPADKFVSGDAYDQVASSLRSVQPRLQKWIEQAEGDESGHLGRFLEINDAIHQALARYDAVASGTESASRRATNSLISFDDDDDNNNNNNNNHNHNSNNNNGSSGSGAGHHHHHPHIDKYSSHSTPGPSKPPQSLSILDELESLSVSETHAPPSAKAKAKQDVFDLLGDINEPSGQAPRAQMAATSASAPSAPASRTSEAPPRDPFAGLDLLS